MSDKQEKADAKLYEEQEGDREARPDSVGVPQEPTTGNEPQGPEDALGPGKTRGDYSDRLGEQKDHFEGGVHQNPRVENVGDTEGLKGGVETSDEDD